jgi:hypothetical protein
VAEERNGVVSELRTLLLESELESIVGGSEVVYNHRRRQRRSEKGRVCAFRVSTIPLLEQLVHAAAPYPGRRPFEGLRVSPPQ